MAAQLYIVLFAFKEMPHKGDQASMKQTEVTTKHALSSKTRYPLMVRLLNIIYAYLF